MRLGAEMSAVEGAGIGLSLSKSLVESMNGRIGFSSVEDEGSIFWVDFKRAGKAPSATDKSPPIDLAVSSGGYSLLYVEDNPSNLRLMESLVANLDDVTMYAAPSGPLGLELARAHRPDVIVLDLNLPGMTGIEILRALKAIPELWETPVIALTAAARPGDVQRGLEAGFFRYITKPMDIRAFLDAVEAALAYKKQDRSTVHPLRRGGNGGRDIAG